MKNLTGYKNIAVIHYLDDGTPFRDFECANYHEDLIKGDLCVVMSAHHGMGLAEVVEIKESAENVIREVVARVDANAYYARVEQRKKAAELKTKMQERAKKLQDVLLFQTLAKEDPEMAELLQAYQAVAE